MRRGLRRTRSMSGHERSVLALACLSSFGSFYTMAVTGFAVPQIQRGLGIPEDALGSLLALLRLGTLFSLPLAVLADRLGRRRLLIASVAGCALCNLATAFAPDARSFAWLQLGARCFLGGQILLAGVVVSEELSASNRGRGLGLLAAVGSVGGGLTLLVYAFVDRMPFGWRSLFAVGAFGLLCVPLLWRELRETRRFLEGRQRARATANPGPAGWLLRDLLRQHGWRLAAMVGVVAPLAVILEPGSTFVSKHLQDDLGYSPAAVGLWVAGCGITSPLGNLLSGTLSDRFGRKPVAVVMCLLLSLGIALFYDGRGVPVLALGLALVFFCLGGLLVLQTALAAELFPTAFRSTAAGVREAVGTLGAALGLWLLSVLYGATGSHSVSITWVLLLTPISPLVLLFLPETARRELEEIAPEPVRA